MNIHFLILGLHIVVKERIMTIGKDGGLCLGPSHTLEPPTSWENIVAFFEAIDAFGEYGD